MSVAETHSAAAPGELAANGFPLDPGVHLIEASAGTGKTFTLAHLVLRLVGERQLSLRSLLVVTFTKAAAAELRDRIGRRLQQAQQLLQTPDPAGHGGLDQELKDWLGSIASEDYEQLRAQLLLALEELDAADITTIHGFCHRSLQRQALEAGLAPEVELEDDGALLQEQVVHDYWQQQVLPLPAHALRGLISRGVEIKGLQTLLATLEGDPTLASPDLPPGWDPEQPLPPSGLASGSPTGSVSRPSGSRRVRSWNRLSARQRQNASRQESRARGPTAPSPASNAPSCSAPGCRHSRARAPTPSCCRTRPAGFPTTSTQDRSARRRHWLDRCCGCPVPDCWQRQRPWWTLQLRRCSAISATGPGRNWRGDGSAEDA